MEPRHDLHDGLAEKVERVAHLLAHAQPLGAHFVGLPEFDEDALGVDHGGVLRFERVGEGGRGLVFGEQEGDLLELIEHALALGLGGVGGEGGSDTHPGGERAHLLRARAALLQAGDGVADTFPAGLAGTVHADDLLLFRDVHQLEEDGEGAGEAADAVGIVEGRRVVGGHEAARLLDELRAFLRGENAPEQIVDPFKVVAQGFGESVRVRLEIEEGHGMILAYPRNVRLSHGSLVREGFVFGGQAPGPVRGSGTLGNLDGTNSEIERRRLPSDKRSGGTIRQSGA